MVLFKIETERIKTIEEKEKVNIEWFINMYCSYSNANIILSESIKVPIRIDKWNILVNLELFKLKLNENNDRFLLYKIFSKAEKLTEDYHLENDVREIEFRRERKERFLRAWNKAKALHYLEDSFRFLYFNKKIIDRFPILSTTRDNLLEKSNFIEYPKHLQFLNALIREIAIPEEECYINEDIRIFVDILKETLPIKNLTEWNLADRIRTIWKEESIINFYLNFLEDDIEKNKVQKEDLWLEQQDEKEEKEDEGIDNL